MKVHHIQCTSLDFNCWTVIFLLVWMCDVFALLAICEPIHVFYKHTWVMTLYWLFWLLLHPIKTNTLYSTPVLLWIFKDNSISTILKAYKSVTSSYLQLNVWVPAKTIGVSKCPEQQYFHLVHDIMGHPVC